MIPDETVQRARAYPVPSLMARYTKLRQAGSDKMVGLCPFHAERTPSFYVWNDHYHCWGCGAHGDAISGVQTLEHLSFQDAVAKLTGEAVERLAAPLVVKATKPEASREKPAALWHRSVDAVGTLAQTYLATRGILATPPSSLRFLPRLTYWMGGDGGPQKGGAFPVLLAALQKGHGQIVAVQRIYLARDGNGKAAVAQPKKVFGTMEDGAVRLAEAQIIMGIAEGVETALSAMQVHRVPVWAACGGARMKDVWFPRLVQQIVIYADNGEEGRVKAAAAAAAYTDRGYSVVIYPPPSRFKDWNDVVTGTVRDGA